MQTVSSYPKIGPPWRASAPKVAIAYSNHFGTWAAMTQKSVILSKYQCCHNQWRNIVTPKADQENQGANRAKAWCTENATLIQQLSKRPLTFSGCWMHSHKSFLYGQTVNKPALKNRRSAVGTGKDSYSRSRGCKCYIISLTKILSKCKCHLHINLPAQRTSTRQRLINAALELFTPRSRDDSTSQNWHKSMK